MWRNINEGSVREIAKGEGSQRLDVKARKKGLLEPLERAVTPPSQKKKRRSSKKRERDKRDQLTGRGGKVPNNPLEKKDHLLKERRKGLSKDASLNDIGTG